jgi:hypothetical protein
MKRCAALALVVAVLVGCAPPRTWNKPGATQVDHNRDSYACEKDVRQSHPSANLADLPTMRAMYGRCMQAHGWVEAAPGQSGFQPSTPP